MRNYHRKTESRAQGIEEEVYDRVVTNWVMAWAEYQLGDKKYCSEKAGSSPKHYNREMHGGLG